MMDDKPKFNRDTTPKWYVLHTQTGYENVAKINLQRVVEKNNLQDRVFDIVCPEEEVIEEKNGKKVVVKQKVMPTYLLVKMIYGDDIWHRIVGTRGITGFVGPKGRPLELKEQEIIAMRLEKTEAPIDVKPMDTVEIIDGAFDKVIGTVAEVDVQQSKVKVMVEMFGRDTPIDVNLNQIRKIN